MTRLLIKASVTVYRVLLRRFPMTLRARYGDEMVELFARDLEERARKTGLLGILEGWTRATRDLARPLPQPVNQTAAEHRGKETRLGRSIRGWTEDFGFAWRALRREPAFIATVVAVLGAGIALNAAVFAVVNAYLLRPLPYPESDRLVTLRSPVEVEEGDTEGVLEKRVTWDLDGFTLIGDQGPELALGAWVTPDFLEVYGVEPALGRVFAPEEGVPGAAPVVLISYGLWQERYGGARDVLGRSLQAYTSDRPDDAEAFTIVGVLPHDFWHFNDYTQVLASLREDRTVYAGRLVAGMPTTRAAELLTERVVARVPGIPPDFAVEVVKTHDQHVASIRPTLLALQSAVFLVFLIACANAAVLLLVRSARRERELGIRRALGASEGRLGRQLVFEGAILTSLAGVSGLALGSLALEGVRSLSALTLWRTVPGGADAVSLDATVLGVTVGLCAATGMLFGLVPLISVGRRQLVACLGDGGRGSTDTTGRRRARSVMVGVEIALSLALLAGAGLMVQSAINLQNQDLGFDPSGILKGQVGLQQANYPTAESRLDFFEAFKAGVEALPAVEMVGMVNAVPFTWRFGPRGIETESGSLGQGVRQLADSDYFAAMGIEFIRGRGFAQDDVLGAPEVVIVSETLAEELWPGQDPIGQRLRSESFRMSSEPIEEQPWATVVGVVRDVTKGVRGSEAGDLYWSFSQTASFWMNLVIRSPARAPSLVTDIEAVLAGLDPNVPFSAVRVVSEAVESATAPSRFLATLFATFAGLALVLAVVGLYGVMAYAARQARKNVAIRMALGADAGDVKRFFFRQAGVVLIASLAVGLASARMLGSTLEDQLHGIEPGDPATLFGVAGLLGVTTLLAVWVPVRRAARMAPMVVLREE